MNSHSGSGSFTIQDILNQPTFSSPQQSIFSSYSSSQAQQQQQQQQQQQPLPPSSFLNEQLFFSAALAASHSYPPPTSFLSTLTSSLNPHTYNLPQDRQPFTPTNNPSENSNESKKLFDYQTLPNDVKNLIGSSLSALGLDNMNEDEFDKAASNEQNTDFLLLDNDIESFERSTTPATNHTSPIHSSSTTTTTTATTVNPMTRPMNIPNSFTNQQFSHSSLAKSPFDAPNQLLDPTIGSVNKHLFYTSD